MQVRPDNEIVTVEITLAVTPTFVHDVFTTACEGGIDYWAEFSEYRWKHDGEPDLWTFGATIVEDGESEPVTIGRYVILAGIRKILTGDHGSLLRDNLVRAIQHDDAGEVDADFADSIVQVGLFGEVRYG